MSVDLATVRRIAHLSRIALRDDEAPHLQQELNAILAFVEELSAIEVEGVEPMTSVIPMRLPLRTAAGQPTPTVSLPRPYNQKDPSRVVAEPYERSSGLISGS